MRHAALNLRLATGWMLMASGAVICGLSDGKWLSMPHGGAALGFALLLVLFLFVFFPCLGSIHEAGGVLSALVVGASAFLILNHILDHRAEGWIAEAYHALQDFTHWLLSKGIGDTAATVITRPLYIVAAMLLLVSLAMRRVHGFLAIYGLLLASGLYPFSLPHLLAYLLWFAGFVLILQPQFHLPLALRSRVRLNSDDRFFLLTLRDRPLTESETKWHLCGSAAPSQEPPWLRGHLQALSAAGLIEFDPAARLVVASPLLRHSDLVPGTAAFVEIVSRVAQVALIILAGTYFILPVDFLPEALLGPIGFVDDLLVAALGLLPVAQMFRGGWRTFLKGRRPSPKSANRALTERTQR